MKGVADVCKLLGDLSRLRLLRLLQRERLNVTELTGILGLSQSGISRHLKMLAGAGLVSEHREGSWTYYEALQNGGRIVHALAEEIAEAPDKEGDLSRLEQTLRQRRERATAPFSEKEGLPIPGRSWMAWCRALIRLLPAHRVADIGCGEGGLALELCRSVDHVIAVDRSPEVLERARERIEEAGVRNVQLEQGEIEQIPIRSKSVDVCVLSQALHHAASPPAGVKEATRILRPGGILLVLDLEPHHQEWVRDKLGDIWLGFSGERLIEIFEGAGLTNIDYEALPKRRGEVFQINVTSGRKPERK